MKQGVLVMWLVLLVGMLVGGRFGAIAGPIFWLLAVVHLVEFFWKRSVLEKAGGSMGQHFIQVMIYGLFHWKPLEEAQQGGSADSA